MSTTLQDDFHALAHASLRVSSALMADMSEGQLVTLHDAMRAGAQMVIEFGPLPAFEHARLVLVEREGKRHNLGSVGVVHGVA